MTKLYIKDRIAFFKDYIKNGGRYRRMRRSSGRNWYCDMRDLSPYTQFRFDIDDKNKINVFYVDDKPVAKLTFAQTALFYRFLKRCLYR